MEKRYRSTIIARNVSLILLVLSLFLLLSGVTFAVYSKFMKGTTNNVIQAGRISFSYDEDPFQENGVKIDDAYPISDSVGKNLNGKNEYFDFSVNAISTISNLDYQVIVLKQPQSTLHEGYVKTYVTLRNGNSEIPSSLVVKDSRVLTYYDLTSTSDGLGKIVYHGVVPKSENQYHQEFRLRLWVADDVFLNDPVEDKIFSVKVKVVANEVR